MEGTGRAEWTGNEGGLKTQKCSRGNTLYCFLYKYTMYVHLTLSYLGDEKYLRISAQ